MSPQKTDTEWPWQDQENYRLLLKNLDDYGVFMTDADGYITAWSESAERQTGFTGSEAVGKNFSFIFPKTDVKAGTPEKHLQDAANKGQSRQEIKLVRQDSSEYWGNVLISAIRDSAGQVRSFSVIIKDVSEQKSAEEVILYHSTHDSLTGLPNRRLLQDSLGAKLNESKRNKEMFAVLIIGMDRFKEINDTEGYDMGDTLLKQVAVRLETAVKKDDLVARSGGDEFTVILRNVDPDKAAKSTGKIHSSLKEVFMINSKRVHATASIGGAVFPKNGRDARKLLRSADTALTQTKKGGGNAFKFYEERRS
jgi:diguanylate cyclase (GGDEF)-like protein/PAS domain S-box-containing protein